MLVVTPEYFLDLRGLQTLSKRMAFEYRQHVTFLDFKLSHLGNGFPLPTPTYLPDVVVHISQVRCADTLNSA